MTITVYGIRNCDTMKKAFAWLEAAGLAYTFHDYRQDGVPKERLAIWARQVGHERLANTRGTTWRRIPEAERTGLDARGTLALLAKHPSAIRRPVVEAGQALLVGFDPAEFAARLRR